jgi:hypothetical protein
VAPQGSGIVKALLKGDKPPFAYRATRRVLREVSELNLNLLIQAKWRQDSKVLPLTPAHRELYDIIHRHYWRALRDFPNLIAPRDYNDRMQWLKLFDQSQAIVVHSDKVQFKSIVRQKLGEGYTPEILQLRQSFSEIDFDRLPDRFVLKTNHDSGTVHLVHERSSIDYRDLSTHFNSSLSRTYGWHFGEWSYRFIPPKIFAEAYIETEDGKPPADYKFYCSEGRVKFLHFIYDRYTPSPKEQVIDIDGRDMKLNFSQTFQRGDAPFIKPNNWNELIAVAEELSNGFKFVRVDLYRSRKSIFVGEMTFWPGTGTYRGVGQRSLGQLLDFDLATIKPCIVPQLLRLERRANGSSKD